MKKILLMIMLIAFSLDGYSLQKGGVVSLAASAAKSRVTFIYQNMFKLYVSDQDNSDTGVGLQYMSSGYLKLWNKISRIDARNPGDIGFFDSDHWIQGQDWCSPKFEVGPVTIVVKNKAKAVVWIKDCGSNATKVVLSLVFERQNWFIDDFIVQGSSEKRSMLDYINVNSTN